MTDWTPSAVADFLVVERGEDELTLPAPWIKVVTLAGLTMREGEQRGEDLIVPRAPGAVPMQHLRGPLSADLRCIINSTVDRAGDPTALSPRAQMQAHIDWLLYFAAPVDAAPWTLPGKVVLTTSEEERAAPTGVRLELLDDVEDIHSSWGRCSLRVHVPWGRFEVAAP